MCDFGFTSVVASFGQLLASKRFNTSSLMRCDHHRLFSFCYIYTTKKYCKIEKKKSWSVIYCVNKQTRNKTRQKSVNKRSKRNEEKWKWYKKSQCVRVFVCFSSLFHCARCVDFFNIHCWFVNTPSFSHRFQGFSSLCRLSVLNPAKISISIQYFPFNRLLIHVCAT